MNSESKVEKFWDRTASNYDREEKKDEKTYVQIIEKTRNYINPSDTVLDFGCGTGLVSNEISENVRKIYAIDISSKMIDIAKNKAGMRNIQNIEYIHTTIFDEKFEPGSFDIILAFYILHLTNDSQKC